MAEPINQYFLHVHTRVVHAWNCQWLRSVPPGRLRATELEHGSRCCPHCIVQAPIARRPAQRCDATSLARVARRRANRETAAKVLELLHALRVPWQDLGRLVSRLTAKGPTDDDVAQLAALLSDSDEAGRAGERKAP